MNYYNEIKNKIIDEEIYQSIKDYSKEHHKVKTYFEIGEILYNAGKHYGENIIGEYSKKFVQNFGTKYDRSNLFRMRKMYFVFSNEKVATVWQQLN